MDLFPLDPPVAKPSGGEFTFWRNQTTFSTTLHVDAQSPRALDANPGTEALPFKTIARAAELLRPGQRVLVQPGVYRECIRPAVGGESPSQMIGYHAAPGGQVVVKGSEPVASWSADADGLWVLDLAGVDFADYNPFAVDNLTDASFDIMDWAQPHRGKRPYTLPRGMVFQAGQRLECAGTREELLAREGSHWTDRQDGRLFVRTFGGADPNAVLMEITTRRGCFRPRVRGLGFIHVCGFIFEQVGNGFPRPQEGAVSVCAGHHWLIEGNTIRDVNGVGIDIGNGWYGGAAVPPEPGQGEPEWNIVRRNRVVRTGVCGIAGLPAKNALIEENSLETNSRFPIAEVSESAGIKTHANQGTLIRRNVIRDNPINGIWMDWDNRDSRCTQNVMIACGTGIFIEASVVEPFCVIDRNIIWGAKQGIYEHDCRGQTFVHNFIGQSDEGMNIRGKVTDRVIAGQLAAGGGHTIANNAFFNVPAEINDTTSADFPPNKVSGNALGAAGLAATLDQERKILTLMPAQPQAAMGGGPRVSHDFLDRPWPADDGGPGPVPVPGDAPVELPLGRWPEAAK